MLELDEITFEQESRYKDIRLVPDTTTDTATSDSETGEQTTAGSNEDSATSHADTENRDNVDSHSEDSETISDIVAADTAPIDTSESYTDDTETSYSETGDSETITSQTEDSEMPDSVSDSVSDPANEDTETGVNSDTEEPRSSDSDLVDSDTGPPIDVALVLNPYETVDWGTWTQYKANFHTHTTNSDGSDPPEVVIEQYHSKSYDILAITDHDFTTWPWTDYGMDPSTLGMLAVKGEEYSQTHHVNAFYNFTETAVGMATGIPHVHELGGLSQINHPGRYAYANETYLDYYKQYTSCIWLEVFNQGDRYPGDRERWDQINESMYYEQGKFVWGSSNDDKHATYHLYRNFQFMLAPELTEDAIRTAQVSGAFYFAYEPEGTGDAKVPRIISIEADNDAKTITVNATGYDTIRWIGPGTETVAEGTVFDFADYANRTQIKFILDAVAGYTKKPFVRFVLDGPYGDSYSQPFGFEANQMETEAMP